MTFDDKLDEDVDLNKDKEQFLKKTKVIREFTVPDPDSNEEKQEQEQDVLGVPRLQLAQVCPKEEQEEQEQYATGLPLLLLAAKWSAWRRRSRSRTPLYSLY